MGLCPKNEKARIPAMLQARRGNRVLPHRSGDAFAVDAHGGASARASLQVEKKQLAHELAAALVVFAVVDVTATCSPSNFI